MLRLILAIDSARSQCNKLEIFLKFTIDATCTEGGKGRGGEGRITSGMRNFSTNVAFKAEISFRCRGHVRRIKNSYRKPLCILLSGWLRGQRSMSGRILVNTAERDIHFRRFPSYFFFSYLSSNFFCPFSWNVTCQITQDYSPECLQIYSFWTIIFFIYS